MGSLRVQMIAVRIVRASGLVLACCEAAIGTIPGGNSMFKKKTPPLYGEFSGPHIMAVENRVCGNEVTRWDTVTVGQGTDRTAYMA